MSCNLQGLSILVTRPEAQAEHLIELIDQAKGRPMRFPALDIQACADPELARAELNWLMEADLAIFVSGNAVRYAFPLMPDDLSVSLKIAAIGKATADALDEIGLPPDYLPKQSFDSEGLLALPQLQQMQGKRVLIVRGNGGRELLRDTLSERGAEVRVVEVYQRHIPKRNPDNLIKNWAQWAQVATVTSNELLDNLMQMLGAEGAALLKDTPTLVISQRMAEHAKELGCQQVILAANASDQAIVEAICQWKSRA